MKRNQDADTRAAFGKQRRTPFGTMLNNYRYQKKMMIEKIVNVMLKANGAQTKYGSVEEGFEVRESTVHAQDGSTVVKVELWKRVAVERVKISTSVVAEKVEEETKDDEWGI